MNKTIALLLFTAACSYTPPRPVSLVSFETVVPPPIMCSQTTGEPWNAARWVSIWDRGLSSGYCKADLNGPPGKVDCYFDSCVRAAGGWRCGWVGPRAASFDWPAIERGVERAALRASRLPPEKEQP